MSFCSGHGLHNSGFLGLKKCTIGRIQGLDSALFISLSRPCRGPTLDDDFLRMHQQRSLASRSEIINKIHLFCTVFPAASTNLQNSIVFFETVP
jgi:hypothetical protein